MVQGCKLEGLGLRAWGLLPEVLGSLGFRVLAFRV